MDKVSKLIAKLITAPKYAYLWLKVRRLVADKQFVEALRLLEKIDSIKPKICPEFYLKRGFIYYATEQDSLAKSDFVDALDLIPQYKRYSAEDKKYLRAFATKYLAAIDRDYESEELADLQINQVDKILRKCFPLRGHPDWEEV